MNRQAHGVELRTSTWILVKGKPQATICADLDLVAGTAISGRRRFPIEGAASDSGWYLILAQGRDHRLIQDAPLAKLSAGCEVLVCTVDEGEIYGAASGWRDGRRVWSVRHDGGESSDLAIEGELPPFGPSVIQEQQAKAAHPDAGDLHLDPIFEVPIELVRNVTSFRPDQPNPGFDGRLVNLEAANPTFLQRLLGG